MKKLISIILTVLLGISGISSVTLANQHKKTMEKNH